MSYLFKRWAILCTLIVLAFDTYAQKGVVLEINTPIYNSTADYLENGFKKAIDENASFIILKINTPGGLLDATRRIVGNIMESPIPVVSYVAPMGAHAGSAGAFIAQAAHISVMSSGSNIGAAHPVLFQGTPDSTMNKKMTEDAAAFIRSIAEKRNKDTGLLIKMVTQSKAISAHEAIDAGIIDFIADNQIELLKILNGKSVKLDSGIEVVLNTQNATIENIGMDFKDKFLNTINNPDVMYLLLLIGMMGILFEFFNPGALAPGIIGAISLILAGYGMSVLPVDYTGLAFVLLAIVLFILELKFPSHALLTITGVISLALGSIFLIKQAPSLDVVHISWTVIIVSVILTTLFFIFLIGIGLKAQKRKTKTGMEGLIDAQGISMEELNPSGRIKVNGEIWNAVSMHQQSIAKDKKVEIIAINNFQLTVKEVTLTSK